MKTKIFVALMALVTLAGCSNTNRSEYYSAIAETQRANAEMHRAKMEALSTMAATGDASAQGAAVMAMALTAAPTVAPQYIEDEALSWGRILAAPVAAVAGIAIQADVAKNASDNATKVQMANYASNEAIQLGQQDMMVRSLEASGSGTQAAVDGLVTLGVAGYGALNTAGEQTTTVATTGLSTSEQIATVGLNTSESIALGSQTSLTTLGTVGLAEVGSVANSGLDSTTTVALGSQTSLTTLGTVGIDGVSTVGQAGMNNIVDLGQSSLTAIENITADSNQTITTMSQDYNSLLNNYNATMENIATQNPSVCTVDGTSGAVTCN